MDLKQSLQNSAILSTHMPLDDIRALLMDHFGDSIILDEVLEDTPPALIVPAPRIAEVCQYLREHPKLFFDYLACITALDNGPLAATLEVIYNLYSIPHNLQLMLKVAVARNSKGESLPSVPSVSKVWRTADWHEREAYDLVGIHFTDHPDLRRILLPAYWEGHPLRKDYQAPATYQGLSID